MISQFTQIPFIGGILYHMKNVIVSLFKLDNTSFVFKKTCKIASFELNCSSLLFLIAFGITYK